MTPKSGLQKVGARYYDPTVGHFISQDTKIIAGSPADYQALAGLRALNPVTPTETLPRADSPTVA